MLVKEQDALVIKKEIERVTTYIQGKKVLIFGCTLFSATIIENLKSTGCEAYAFIDNNATKVGKKCMGLNVCAPNDLLRGDLSIFFIIICSKYHNEMKSQLMVAGIKKSQILDIPVAESIGEVSDSVDTFRMMVSDVKKGYDLYQSIYREGQRIFLCPYPGTGDVYLACAHLKAYIDKTKCERYLLLVTKENCRQVSELFGKFPVEVISQEHSSLLLKAWEFLGDEAMNIKPLLYWGWRTKRFLHADRHPQITFYDNFCHDAFGVKYKLKFDKPYLLENKLILDEYIDKYGIKRGKTAIIAPFAGSFISQIKSDEWEEVSNKLKRSGYRVFTNCSDKETEIAGTERIFFPYKLAIPILEHAGMFIGVRTGLCEVLSSANCKQIIIYENGLAASDYEYFSLRKMGISENVIEVVYGKDTHRLYDLIKGTFDNYQQRTVV